MRPARYARSPARPCSGCCITSIQRRVGASVARRGISGPCVAPGIAHCTVSAGVSDPSITRAKGQLRIALAHAIGRARITRCHGACIAPRHGGSRVAHAHAPWLSTRSRPALPREQASEEARRQTTREQAAAPVETLLTAVTERRIRYLLEVVWLEIV